MGELIYEGDLRPPGDDRVGIPLAVHRPREDWLLICFSPSLAESGYSGAPAASALIAGFIIIFVAQLEIVALSRWAEIINLICGAWILVAPLILGYSGNLRLWHFGLVRRPRCDHHPLRVLARQQNGDTAT